MSSPTPASGSGRRVDLAPGGDSASLAQAFAPERTGEHALPELRARQQAVVAELGVRALGGLPLAELLQEASEQVAATLGTELVKVVELLPNGHAARVVAGIGWRRGVVGEAILAVGRTSQAGYALLSHAPVIVDDLTADARFEDPPLLRDHHVVSGISVILYGARGASYGVLGAHTAVRRRFTIDDVSFLQGVANVLSAAMERAEAEHELRRAHALAESAAAQLQEQAGELEHQMEEAQALADELERANARLERAVADAERARDGAEAARARTTAILDSLSDVVASFDADWRWRYLNPSARAVVRSLGLDPEAVIGRVLWDALPQLRRSRFEAEMRRAVTDGVVVEFEAHLAELNQWLETRVVPGADGQVMTFSRDVTERHRALDIERVAADRARRLLAVAAGLSAARTPEQVADVIFREGMVAVGADAGSFALVRRDPASGREFEIVRTAGFAPQLVERYRRFPVQAGRPLSDAVLARAPRLLANRAEWRSAYPTVEPSLDGLGFEAFAAVPVTSGGDAIAALTFSFREPRVFDDGTRTFLATLGEQCGLALERARAYEAERRAHETSAFLADASRLLTSSLDYETTLGSVARAAVPRLGDWCAVDVVRDPTSPTWPPVLDRLAVVHEDPAMLALAETLATRYPTDWEAEDGMAAVLRTGTSILIPEVTEEMLVARARDAEHLALLRALHFSSVIVVPLLARGRTIGALTLCATARARRYDETDLALAQDLAQRAAVAVDNARLFRDAESAREAAEEANRSKSQFLATMSHELRTPLNAIAGHVQLLELELHGPITDAQRDTLRRVDRAQHHLLGLINDVLNYARIESGRVEYDLQPVRVADVVRDVRPMVEPLLHGKGLLLDVRLPDDTETALPLLVWADREKLAQVLLNLLSNAVKFTPPDRDGVPGRVSVELSDRADESSPPDQVYLRVIDTGVGIPDDKLDAVFEPFVQVRGDFTRDTGGTGLGLAISRDLARGMGGDLRVRSVVGEGSTFTMTLRRVVSKSGDLVDRRTGEERRVEEERREVERREG